jgi:hypothetical protein
MTQVTKNTVKNVSTNTKLVEVPSIKAVEAVEAKIASKSASQEKIETRVKELLEIKATRPLTMRELIYLTNAEEKLESKTISRVYRELQLKYIAGNERILLMLGKSEFPTFKEWAEKMPVKYQYSFYSGLECLAKFNNVAKTATRVQRQNKQVAAI